MPSRARGWPEPSRPSLGRRPAHAVVSSRESILMMDVVYFALTAVLFSLTWGLVRLCERV
jgi:hypothetical protein